jgi:hypothetical protein
MRIESLGWNGGWYTAMTKRQKFETNIPRKGISGCQSQFLHSCVCERIILYIPTMGLPFLLEEIGGSILGIYNRSQTHECRIGTEAAQFPEKEYINGIAVAVYME